MKVKACLLLPALAFLTLASCHNSIVPDSNTDSSQSSSVDPYPSWTPGTNPIEGATQPSVKRPKGTKNEFGKMRNGQDKSGLPQKGQANVLVVPVQFNGDDDTKFTNLMTDNLDSSFFGDAYTYDMVSVQEYYKESSYGKLDIGGVIAPTYTVDMSKSELIVKANYTSVASVISDIMADIYKTYFTGDTATYDPHDFDSDSDGYIDNIVLCYAEPYINGDLYTYSTTAAKTLYTSLFGNQTYFHSSYASKNVPVGSFTWESYYDAYTISSAQFTTMHDNREYIKQMGAAMGLSYYTDSYSKRSPLGDIDMMDGAILDHNPFSKYLMGWIEPTIIESKGSVESSYDLKPFQEDGSALLVADEFSNSPYGEYLLISYYTPTGLNEVDSDLSENAKKLVQGTYPYEAYMNGTNLETSGIQVYKVDARLVVKTDNGYALNVDGLDFDKNTYDFAYSNDNYAPYAEYGIAENYALVELLSKNGMNRHMTSTTVTLDSDDFFQKGDEFGAESQADGFYKNFKFDSGEKLGLNFKVAELNESQASLTFERG